MCREYRTYFRVRFVKDEVYRKISDGLYENGYDYSHEQLREKMRNIKRAFNEAKNGKHGGLAWPNFNDMVYIYDEPIPEEVNESKSALTWSPVYKFILSFSQ